MLSDQHKFVTKLLNPQYIQEYRSHMCGVCHALGSNFNLPARLLTSHDLVLLSILSEAQAERPSRVTYQQCPISLIKSHPSIADLSAQYSAAVGVLLATLKLDDDAIDEPQIRTIINIGRTLTRSAFAKAQIITHSLGLSGSALVEFNDLQKSVEKAEAQSSDMPTAKLSQELFEVTAGIAGAPTNRTVLRELGYHYGRYIYWMDAFRDFPHDIIAGKFNPLSGYAVKANLEYTLSIEGIQYLRTIFSEIRQHMRSNLGQLFLVRHQALLEMLLLKPVDEILVGIDARLQRAEPLTFRRFSALDVARAGLFLLPVVSVTALTTADPTHFISQANACVQTSQEWVNSGSTQISTDMRMLGFSLGSLDWIRDILPQITEIGDGPCTAICNGPCSSICNATNPAACCEPNPDVGSNCWTCGGAGCLNACETLF